MAPFVAVQQVEKPIYRKSEEKAQVEQTSNKVKLTNADSLALVKAKAKANLQMAMEKLKHGQGRALAMVKDPQFRTVTISSASGAVVLGSVGGAFGTASGLVLGTAAGVVPALFTFGLSLPVGAVVGGATGFCMGTSAGAGIGALGGGVAGFGGYKYRVEIKDGLVTIQKKAAVSQQKAKLTANQMLEKTKASVVVFVDGVKQRGNAAGEFAKARAGELAKLPQQAMASDKFKVTAATTTAGVAVGGCTGAVVGTTTGAALGLIPALFTFGLSIPVGAVVGGCIGTTTGSAVGAAGGSAVGFGGYTYRKAIRTGADTLVATVKEQTASAKSKASASVAKLGETIKSRRSTKDTSN